MKQDKAPPTAGEVAASDGDRIADRYDGEAADATTTQQAEQQQVEREPVTASETSAAPADPRPSRKERAGDAARTVGRGASWVRTKVAQVVWLVAVLCAVVLGAGALLIALDANTQNGLVSWVLDRAGQLDGPFYDIFTFSGADAVKKQVLVGWALGAVAYLVVGRVLDRIIRP